MDDVADAIQRPALHFARKPAEIQNLDGRLDASRPSGPPDLAEIPRAEQFLEAISGNYLVAMLITEFAGGITLRHIRACPGSWRRAGGVQKRIARYLILSTIFHFTLRRTSGQREYTLRTISFCRSSEA